MKVLSGFLLIALSCGGAPLAFAQTGSCSSPSRVGQVIQNTTIRVGVDSVLWVYVTRDSVNRRCSLSFLPPRVDTVIKIRVDTVRVPVSPPPPPPPPPPAPAPTPPPAPAPVPPPAPAPPSSWNAHEPSGMTMLTDRAFNARVENGWGDIGGSNFSIVVDSTAPRSSSSVGQALFDPMIACGVGPINTWSPKLTNPRTLYVSFWLKMDPAWYGNISTVNKVLFISIGNGGRVFVPVVGSGTGPLSIQVRLQGMGVHVPAISWNAYANVTGANTTITRGQWAHVEIVLVANTPGQLDGQVDYWLNGGKVAHYANVGYSAATETGAMNVWQGVKWNPTYGGGCNGPSANGKPLTPQFPVPQWQRIDHLYISGKP